MQEPERVFVLGGKDTGYKGTVSVSLPTRTRQWAYLRGGTSRKDSLAAVPVGLSATWKLRQHVIWATVSAAACTDAPYQLAEFTLRADGCNQEHRSVGTPQSACNALLISLGVVGKVNGWVAIGCSTGSVVVPLWLICWLHLTIPVLVRSPTPVGEVPKHYLHPLPLVV